MIFISGITAVDRYKVCIYSTLVRVVSGGDNHSSYDKCEIEHATSITTFCVRVIKLIYGDFMLL